MDTNDLKKQLGYRLRELRLAKGWRQEDLENSGFSYRYYGKIERGLVNPTLETLVRLSDIFEVSLADLFRFIEAGDRLSEDRAAVALKINKVLKGSGKNVKKLKVFLE